MTIQVFVEDSKLSKEIDQIIYESLNGLFRTYESHHGDIPSDPSVEVIVGLREEAEINKFKYALYLHQQIKKTSKDEQPRIYVDDVFVEKGEI